MTMGVSFVVAKHAGLFILMPENMVQGRRQWQSVAKRWNLLHSIEVEVQY